MKRSTPQLALSLAALLIATTAAACGSDGNPADPDGGPGIDAAPDGAPVPGDIVEFLETVDGLTFTEQPTAYAGYRRFVLGYTQPLDHDEPEGRTFVQRVILHHRERARPLVLYTSGYYLFSDDYLSELGASMEANQLDVEQRFFAPSTPSPTLAADWELMRIAQAAADHHRLRVALAPYYNGAWLSTGHSKGGMTSIYHRHFYPDDVDATVAYVAPISFDDGDTRYHTFFDQVATPTCRQALRDVQRLMLTRRAQLQSLLEAAIAGSGTTFNRLNGIEAALEDAIVGMPWSFFQAGSAANCPSIPGAGASDQQLFDFLLNVGGISTDGAIEAFSTYYYQAGVELGYPSIPTAHLSDLLQFPDNVVDFMPAGVTGSHDSAPMLAVDQWVKNEAETILFVYGEFDPWFGGAFDLGSGTSDSFKLVVDGANHGALISDLDPGDRETALSAIERWTGVRPALSGSRVVERPELPTTRVRMHMH